MRCFVYSAHNMPDRLISKDQLRSHALAIFNAALKAVHGQRCVEEALRERPVDTPFYLVAIGKAAAAMTRGAIGGEANGPVAGLVITKHGHTDPEIMNDSRIVVMESDHPVPGSASIRAGEALLSFIDDTPADATLLFLLSGGASSLVEVLPPNLELSEYRKVNAWLLGSGLDIHQINIVRKRFSAIKGGKLKRYLDGRKAGCLLISDVPGDNPASVGSGLLVEDDHMPLDFGNALPDWLQELLQRTESKVPRYSPDQDIPHRIVADNRRAREAACRAARGLGYSVINHNQLLTGDSLATGRQCAQQILQGEEGVSVWSGETTIELPTRPGRGGRNQSVALVCAQAIAGAEGCVILAAGSDGTDGPTEDAGALVDGETLQRGAEEGYDAAECLRRADAGTFLAASGDLIQTGPTGTNVMDLLIGIRVG